MARILAKRIGRPATIIQYELEAGGTLDYSLRCRIVVTRSRQDLTLFQTFSSLPFASQTPLAPLVTTLAVTLTRLLLVQLLAQLSVQEPAVVVKVDAVVTVGEEGVLHLLRRDLVDHEQVD